MMAQGAGFASRSLCEGWAQALNSETDKFRNPDKSIL